MKAILNIKTDVEVKRKAQKIAKEMGVPLSTIVNAQLKQLISERRMTLRAPLIPNARTRKTIDDARKELRRRRGTSPTFDTAKDAIRWLHPER